MGGEGQGPEEEGVIVGNGVHPHFPRPRGDLEEVRVLTGSGCQEGQRWLFL